MSAPLTSRRQFKIGECMLQSISLGSAPANEECAQVGSDRYEHRAWAECYKYIQLLRKLCGDVPETIAFLRCRSEEHDFGKYYEVYVLYYDDNEMGVSYAFHLDNNAPLSWDDTELKPWCSSLEDKPDG